MDRTGKGGQNQGQSAESSARTLDVHTARRTRVVPRVEAGAATRIERHRAGLQRLEHRPDVRPQVGIDAAVEPYLAEVPTVAVAPPELGQLLQLDPADLRCAQVVRARDVP